MNKNDLRSAILISLQNKDLTKNEVVATVLRSSDYRSFQTETTARADVEKMLTTLKLEHRIWFANGKYTLTSKGRKTHNG